MKCLLIMLLVAVSLHYTISAQNIQLPEPQKSGGKPLIECLSERSTNRWIDNKELSLQQVSDLLWAAFGVNRPDGKRTAPSVLNYQEIDLFVLLKSGIYRYKADSHELIFISNEDIRYMAGKQDQIKDGPIHIIMVSNLEKMGKAINFDKMSLTFADAGHISQNIYLFAASEGLVTGVRHWVSREKIEPKLGLKKSQVVTLCHCIGYEKKQE